MIIHCGFSSLFYWANGLTPVQHHNASLLTMIKTLGCHVCNTVPGCEVFLFMLANDAHVGAISLITTTVKTLVGPSPLHCPSHSTTPGEWILVGWRLDCNAIFGHHNATNLCIYHDNCLFINNVLTITILNWELWWVPNLHRIWILKKSLANATTWVALIDVYKRRRNQWFIPQNYPVYQCNYRKHCQRKCCSMKFNGVKLYLRLSD